MIRFVTDKEIEPAMSTGISTLQKMITNNFLPTVSWNPVLCPLFTFFSSFPFFPSSLELAGIFFNSLSCDFNFDSNCFFCVDNAEVTYLVVK